MVALHFSGIQLLFATRCLLSHALGVSLSGSVGRQCEDFPRTCARDIGHMSVRLHFSWMCAFSEGPRCKLKKHDLYFILYVYTLCYHMFLVWVGTFAVNAQQLRNMGWLSSAYESVLLVLYPTPLCVVSQYNAVYFKVVESIMFFF